MSPGETSGGSAPPPSTATGRAWPLHIEIAVFLGTAALVLAVLLPTLGRLALWYDEILTADVAEKTWKQLVHNRFLTGHFPTYFALIKILGLGAANEFWLRLPSALFSAAAAGLLAVIALRFSGVIAVVVTALLYALLPILISYGQEARPYAMMLFFVALAMLGHMSLLAAQPFARRHARIATVGAIGTALAIPAGIVAVAVLHLGALASGALRGPDETRRLWRRHFAVTWGVTLFCALGLVPGFVKLARGPEGLMKWQVEMTATQRFEESFRQIYGFWIDQDAGRYLPAVYETWLAIAFLALIAIGVAASLRRTIDRYLIVTAIGTPLAFVVIGAFTAVTPRYLLGMMPATVLLVASGVAALLARPAWRIPAIIAVAIFFLGASLQAADMVVSERKLDFRQVAALLHENGVRNVEILTNHGQIPRDIGHYLRDADGITFQSVRPPLESMDRIWAIAKDRDPAWIAAFNVDQLPPDVTAGRTACRWQFSYLSIFVVTRDRTLLPPALKDCQELARPG